MENLKKKSLKLFLNDFLFLHRKIEYNNIKKQNNIKLE